MTTTNPPVAAAPPAEPPVELALASPFDGWTFTARTDFSVRVLAELQSRDIARIIAALDQVILSHNFPNADGKLAAQLEDVSPWKALTKIVEALVAGMGGKLPNP